MRIWKGEGTASLMLCGDDDPCFGLGGAESGKNWISGTTTFPLPSLYLGWNKKLCVLLSGRAFWWVTKVPRGCWGGFGPCPALQPPLGWGHHPPWRWGWPWCVPHFPPEAINQRGAGLKLSLDSLAVLLFALNLAEIWT